MFEKFDSGARQVLVLAQEQAVQDRALDICPIHLLAGVAQSRYVDLPGSPYTVGARVLREMGLKDHILRELVRGVRVPKAVINIPSQPGDDEPPSGQIPLTEDSKKILELALREGISLGHNTIRAEHILLGLVRLGDAGVLGAFTELPRLNVIHWLSSWSKGKN